LYGGRITLLVAVLAVTLSALLGTILGLLAGFCRGAVDEIIMRVADVQLAIPVLLLAITLIAVLDVSLQNIILVLALSGWVPYARILRSQVLSIKEREFICAAIALGASRWHIIPRHVLPNVIGTCLVLATLDVANMMILEAALSFLGLGVRPPAFSWGSIMGDGRDYISTSWWIVTFPGLAISVVILSVNLLGDALRDHYDPQLRM
jgi:peptide/nickel transport system permease protein